MQTPQLLGIALGTFSTAIGSVVAYTGLGMVRKAKATMRWPSAEGQIVRSEGVRILIPSLSSSNRKPVYGPEIEYEYATSGHKITGKNIKTGITGSGDSDGILANRYLAKYPVGKTVPVFFNPANPQDSILEPGPSRMTYIPLVTGLLFMVIGPAFGIFFYLIFRS